MCKLLQQLNTLNNLKDLLEHVPQKNSVRKLDLFSYEKRGMNGDIIADFSYLVGIVEKTEPDSAQSCAKNERQQTQVVARKNSITVHSDGVQKL